MATHVTGTEGEVIAGVTTLEISSWTLDNTVPEIDATNTGGGGYSDSLAGAKKASGTVEALWDTAVEATDTPPNINAGAEIRLRLFVESGAGAFWDITTALIVSVNHRSAVNEGVSYSFNYVNKGAFVLP